MGLGPALRLRELNVSLPWGAMGRGIDHSEPQRGSVTASRIPRTQLA